MRRREPKPDATSPTVSSPGRWRGLAELVRAPAQAFGGFRQRGGVLIFGIRLRFFLAAATEEATEQAGNPTADEIADTGDERADLGARHRS